MATGLLRPDYGTALVHGVDVWARPLEAKKLMGILPDGVRLFDRLTGEQLVTYAGLLRGMDRDVVAARVGELLSALDLSQDAGTLVVDYSAGMTKKIALASALIHAPRLLVLDEPFESVDPVSAANIRSILDSYVASGGTVIVSSHVMDLVQRMCDHVAVVAAGRLLAAGTVGLLTSAGQAEHAVATGQADGVFIARAALRDPHWWLRAAFELGHTIPWLPQYERAVPRRTF